MDWNRIEGNWSSRAEPRRSGVGSLTMTSTLSTGAKSSLRVRSRNATGLPRTQAKKDVHAWSNSLTNIETSDVLHPEPPFHEGLKTNRDANRLVDRVLVPNLRYVGTSESN